MDDATRRIGENLDELRKEIGSTTQELRQAVTSYVDEHPLAAVGIAFGVGYLLSGALFSRASLRVATLAGRVAIGGVAKQLFAGIAPGLLFAQLLGGGREEAQPSGRSDGDGNPRH